MSSGKLISAINGVDVAKVEALLRRGADPNGPWILRALGWPHVTPLAAAVNARSPQIAKLLLGMGAAPNRPDRRWATPLWLAARLGCAEVASILLAYRADANLPNPQGITPLEEAMWRRKQDVVELLVAHGAVASSARSNGHKLTPYEDLMCSIMRRDVASVERLLAAGASVHGDAKRRWGSAGVPTPLHAAVYGESLEVTAALLGHGADVNSVERGWEPPIALAAYAGNLALAELLLDGGADVNRRTARGASAIENASWYGRSEMLELLLWRGADPHLVLERDRGSVLRVPTPILRRLVEVSTKRFPEAEALLAANDRLEPRGP